MPSVYRTLVTWSGFQGSPGYTKFSWSDLTTDAARNAAGAAERSFFQAMTSYFATNWTLTYSPEVAEYDAQSGVLVGVTNMTTVPAPTTGVIAPAVYAGGSGGVITWHGNVVWQGRRAMGRTFVVPMQGAFDTDGTLSTGALTQMNAAGVAIIGAVSCEFAIWMKLWDKTGATPVQTDGIVVPVASASVKDMASQLRSRRT